ncbi:hypothetical protein ES705_01766 [subsurface metagenome]|nr:hypothetical protein [Clostridia bacterium]
MINLRERFFSILNGKIPDKLPWYGDLTYWYTSMVRLKHIDKKYLGLEGVIKLHKDLGIGYYQLGCETNKPIFNKCKCKVIFNRDKGYETFGRIQFKGYKTERNSKNNDIIRIISTPLGELREVWKYIPQQTTWALEEKLVKTISDLKIYKYWIEHTDFEADYDQVEKVRDAVENQGFTMAWYPKSPLMQMITEDIGIANTVNFWMDNIKLFEDLIKVLELRCKKEADIALKSCAEVLMLPENFSSDLVGKNFFDKYLKSYYEDLNKRTKASGKYSANHLDGYLKGLLKEVTLTGFSMIDAMTPKPVGDLSIHEFKDCVGRDVVMLGGIPGSYFTPEASNNEFIRHVKEVIKVMTSEPRYILGIADQIPPNGIIDRVKKVSELVEEYGSY